MKLRKEVSIAVVIGLLIGLVVVGGIIRARTALQNVNPPDLSLSSLSNSPSPSTTSNQQELFLEITTADNQVLTTPTLTLTGRSLPNSYIVILGEKEDIIITPNELGDFTQEISLVSGANTIKVTSWEENGNNTSQTINAVYTTEEI